MILQKDYFAPESRFLCDVCSEPVTNPICPSCLTIEIQAWLTLYPDLKKEIMPKLRAYLRNLDNLATESTTCIKCGHKKTSVCPYCFTEFVLRELRKINSNKVVLMEFLRFFDFDGKGHSKEIEEMEA